MCDAIEMVQAPGRVRVFRPILFAVWTLIFAVACYEAKFVLMGCSETCKSGFCVSMGTNKSENYDAYVKVDRSCCAGVTPETHEAALKTMEMCQVEVIDTSDDEINDYEAAEIVSTMMATGIL